MSNNTYKGFIEQHLHLTAADIMLKYNARLGSAAAFVAEQVECFRKAKVKLPSFFDKGCYYTTRSLEQSTSEAVALYKAKLVKGDTLLEICGGLGVDAWALSSRFQSVVSVDADETLNEICRYNYELLDVDNVQRLTAKAEDYLDSCSTHFSAVYADPDRRPGNTRTGSLKESLPDITALLPRLLELSASVYIKTSPMYDISMGIRELPNVQEVFVIAHRNEVKELLFHCGRLPVPVPPVSAVNIKADGLPEEVIFTGNAVPAPGISTDAQYFFEPNTAIIKSGFYMQYAAMLGLKLINRQLPYFTSDAVPEQFCGRQFRILDILSYNPKKLKQFFKAKGLVKINVAARGITLKPAEILKTLGLEEGGDSYLFVTKDMQEHVLVYYCSKL